MHPHLPPPTWLSLTRPLSHSLTQPLTRTLTITPIRIKSINQLLLHLPSGELAHHFGFFAFRCVCPSSLLCTFLPPISALFVFCVLFCNIHPWPLPLMPLGAHPGILIVQFQHNPLYYDDLLLLSFFFFIVGSCISAVSLLWFRCSLRFGSYQISSIPILFVCVCIFGISTLFSAMWPFRPSECSQSLSIFGYIFFDRWTKPHCVSMHPLRAWLLISLDNLFCVLHPFAVCCACPKNSLLLSSFFKSM